MWQVDNDRYRLWRLEHEFGPKRIDRLLNSVTTTDRMESPTLGWLPIRSFARAIGRLLKPLCSPFLPAAIMRRASE